MDLSVSAVLPAGGGSMRGVAVNATAGRRECYNLDKLSGFSLGEKDVQMADNHVPVSTSCRPVFDNLFRRQIQNFAQGIVVYKGRFVFVIFRNCR